jgi:hypothetical protein
VVPVIFTGYVWRNWRTSTNVFTISCLSIEPTPPPPRPASVILVLQHGGKPCKVSIALFVDYSYYSSPIRGLFVLFVDYSRTIRTIRRLFADYSHYSSTIRGLFALFVDYSHYSHYSLYYSSFINCPKNLARALCFAQYNFLNLLICKLYIN